ncbi:peptide/nickel transport system permease protein [Kribbella sp. VKM Ac-2569]|uniref:ABC transporter permease n=1 Tax=Kribbella sp. VKM Ac-2569 TaxID=2512220 RepID=UPI0010E282BD|nr:ABC transporter permease [Kribbella sp. VKM Ac-2569]RZT27513.1 peptide/nickel transport system permease protein [Kribbella sp. VKM Ac-2569]
MRNNDVTTMGAAPPTDTPPTDTSARPAPRTRTPGGNATVRRYLAAFRTPRGVIGLTILAVLLLTAVLAPVIFPHGYDQQTADSLRGSSGRHLLGTDELGRDLLVRTVYGLRTDFSIIVVAVPLSMIAGTALGLVGALSRVAGAVVQRVLDIILGFPGVVLGVCVVLIMGPGWSALVVAIAIGGLPYFGRQARAALLEQMGREYVVAARTLGVGKGAVLWRHILPNAVDPILVGGAIFVVVAVFIEAGLSIIGLGIQPPTPSLGSLLNVGIRFIEQSPMYILGPTAVLILLSMSFSLLADALNETVIRK